MSQNMNSTTISEDCKNNIQRNNNDVTVNMKEL